VGALPRHSATTLPFPFPHPVPISYSVCAPLRALVMTPSILLAIMGPAGQINAKNTTVSNPTHSQAQSRHDPGAPHPRRQHAKGSASAGDRVVRECTTNRQQCSRATTVMGVRDDRPPNSPTPPPPLGPMLMQMCWARPWGAASASRTQARTTIGAGEGVHAHNHRGRRRGARACESGIRGGVTVSVHRCSLYGVCWCADLGAREEPQK
jgi:hypothetical protein